ncbi:MAG: TVP38/TMEM64 family protein [Hyphomicrobiales bacterium]
MSEMQGDKTAQSKSGALKRFLPLIVLAVLIVVVFVNGWHKYLSLEQIAENREALRGFVDGNFLLAIGAYAALYIAVVALSVPGGALLTITGGFLFGWLIGGIATVAAATAGATVLFLVAKTSLGETLAAKAGPWLQKLSEGFQSDALNYLLFLRLVPAFPFWLVNLAPALLGVPLSTFVIATFIGIIPGTFAFAFLGAGLDSIIDKQRESYQACLDKQSEAGGAGECSFSLDPASLLTPELLAAFVALGIVAIIPVVAKKVRARRTSSS